MNRKHIPYYLAAAGSLITLCVYLSALQNDFVLWDDDVNVYENQHIRSLDSRFFMWAFTDVSVSYWQPVVWISHAVDVALWGADARGHHLTNILLHTANTFVVVLLVIGLLGAARSCRSPAPQRGEGGLEEGWAPQLEDRAILVTAGVTGILFGIHPLHVESVAWITERKDLIYSLFFLLSIMVYVRYAATRNRQAEPRVYYKDTTYLLSLSFFVLAAASKPMAVTLPAVLLLLDWYPLGHVSSLRQAVLMIREKAPFIVISMTVSIATFMARVTKGVVLSLGESSLSERLFVTAKAVTFYLGKMALPLNLSPFYPDPQAAAWLSFEYLAPLSAVCAITVLCWYLSRRQRAYFAAWAYYVITLLPVLGIVRTQSLAMSDRFTYLPSLGPFLVAGLAAAWTWARVDSLKQQEVLAKGLAVAAAIALCLAITSATLKQIAVWKNSITLWNHVIEKKPDMFPAAYHNRGLAFKEQGQLDRALEDFTTTIRLERGTVANTYTSRGLTYEEMGQHEQALQDFNAAIDLDPEFGNAYISRGSTFKVMGLVDLAMDDFNKAISVSSRGSTHRDIAYNDRGLLYLELRRYDQALSDFTTALSLNPFFARAYTNRGLAHELVGSIDRALEDYTAAIRADPSFSSAYNNRGLVYERTGRAEQALEDLTAAIRLDPESVEAHNNRALVYEDLGRFDQAVADYDHALAVRPDDYLSYSNRGIVLRKMGRPESAVEDLTKALSLNPGFAQAYAIRGDCYRDMGKPALALRDYQEACRRGSGVGCEAMRRGK